MKISQGNDMQVQHRSMDKPVMGTAVSRLHSIKATAIPQVANTSKPSTCCQCSHSTGFGDSSNTGGKQRECQARSKGCPRCMEMLWEVTLDPREATILQILRIMLTEVSSRMVQYHCFSPVSDFLLHRK